MRVSGKNLKCDSQAQFESASAFTCQGFPGSDKNPGHPGHGVHGSVTAQMVISASIEKGQSGAEKGGEGTGSQSNQKIINSRRKNQQVKYARVIPGIQAELGKKPGAGIKNFGGPGGQPGKTKSGEGIPKRNVRRLERGEDRPADGQVPGVVFGAGGVEIGVE